MSSSSTKFPSASDQYIPSSKSTVPGATIPKNKHLDGQLVLLYPIMDSDPGQLRLRLKCENPQSTLVNDYVAASPSRRVKWKYNITLVPSESVKNGWADIKEVMLEIHQHMQGLLGHEMKLVVDDMRITNVQGREVDIEARGARMFWTEDEGAWTVFKGEHRRVEDFWGCWS